MSLREFREVRIGVYSIVGLQDLLAIIRPALSDREACWTPFGIACDMTWAKGKIEFQPDVYLDRTEYVRTRRDNRVTDVVES